MKAKLIKFEPAFPLGMGVYSSSDCKCQNDLGLTNYFLVIEQQIRFNFKET